MQRIWTLCILCLGWSREFQIIISVFQSTFLWTSTKCQGLHPWFQEEKQRHRQLLSSLVNVFSEQVISKSIREYERTFNSSHEQLWKLDKIYKTTISRHWTASDAELNSWEKKSVGAKPTLTPTLSTMALSLLSTGKCSPNREQQSIPNENEGTCPSKGMYSKVNSISTQNSQIENNSNIH